MNASDFIAKWRRVELTERASAQSHFLDLCTLVGHPTPVEADPKGEWFTFERGVTKRTGKRGWADVWKREFFAFEYKGKNKHKDLNAAYDQLLLYKGALENPPLLVTCDIERLVIHTNFPGTVEQVHEIRLDELARPEKLDVIQWVFHDKDRLRPAVTREAITNKVAGQLGKIAQGFRDRGIHPRAVAKFLNRLVFCMFAEDAGLLPPNLFTKIVDASHHDPKKLAEFLKNLFAAMASGGTFGVEPIKHFNGNLFEDAAVIHPTSDEMGRILEAARLDWSQVDPSIFGTLFERAMDPGKRSQLGAHYTSREDIETLIEPVVMEPLRREWAEVRREVELSMGVAPEGKKATPAKKAKKKPKGAKKPDAMIRDYLQRLQSVTVLDPACGSGNFLYVALQKLKDLEQEVLVDYEDRGFGKLLPFVGPRQLLGLEVNAYAFDLAQMTVWIGYLQWQRLNGYRTFGEPILQRLDTFRCMDSILDLSDPSHPKEPEWPAAEFIVGNPPFLGNKRMRGELGESYISTLWKLYGDRIPPMSDLCCYWFEKARAAIESNQCSSAGLLATTGITQVGARRALDRIAQDCRIFFGISDRDWILDGASVRICLVGFGPASNSRPALLDGQEVPRINSDLTSGIDLSVKKRLTANSGRCFMGTTKVGDFDLEQSSAMRMLNDPNPHGRPNSDVIRPFRNGSDLVRICTHRWVIDYGVSTPEVVASLYEAPFEFLVKNVKQFRSNNGRRMYRERWWIHGESRPGFRRSVNGFSRYIGTARVAKHRLFVWLDTAILPDSKVIAISLNDDFSFGVVHSRSHEVWTLANCGWHGDERGTYNPSTCFETFPVPEPTDAQRTVISEAARDLDALRSRWLNPPEWTREEVLEFPGSVDGPWSRFVHDPDERGIGTVRYPVLKPRSGPIGKELADRTLTNLYNARPAWLDAAHRKLDAAVFAAYGWQPGMTDDEILAALLALNLQKAEAGAPVVNPSEDDGLDE